MGRLDGKRALVTGSGSGLGRAIALHFAEHGAAVVSCDIHAAGARRTADEARMGGGRAVAVTADVTSQADTDRMVTEARAEFGGLDIVIANAGVAGVGRAHEVDLDRWSRVISVNLTGVWLTCRAALRQFLTQGRGGTIVCIASVGGMVGVPGIAPYAAAKAGVIGLVRQMAVDYGPDGIRVNALCPGTVPTALVRDTYRQGGSAAAGTTRSVDEALASSIDERFPLRRLGKESDIANAALYLASGEASWVTGTTLVVDGGMTAH